MAMSTHRGPPKKRRQEEANLVGASEGETAAMATATSVAGAAASVSVGGAGPSSTGTVGTLVTTTEAATLAVAAAAAETGKRAAGMALAVGLAALSGGVGGGTSAGGGGSLVSKLQVPTPLLTADNNTPTPVRHLLREAEADGLFLPNPFDEGFRQAAAKVVAEGGTAPVTSMLAAPMAQNSSAAKPEEETLNTPQIISILESVPTPAPLVQVAATTANVSHDSSAAFAGRLMAAAAPVTTSSVGSTASSYAATAAAPAFRPIVPALAPPTSEPEVVPLVVGGGGDHGTLGVDTAKLYLQLPNSRQPLHLSDIPVVKPVDKVSAPLKIRRQRSKRTAASTSGRGRSGPDPDDPLTEDSTTLGPTGKEDEKRRQLLERNRAAAKRSRQKKKRQGLQMEEELMMVKAENSKLRQQVSRLQEALAAHADCPITKASTNGVADARRLLMDARSATASGKDRGGPLVRIAAGPVPIAPAAATGSTPSFANADMSVRARGKSPGLKRTFSGRDARTKSNQSTLPHAPDETLGAPVESELKVTRKSARTKMPSAKGALNLKTKR